MTRIRPYRGSSVERLKLLVRSSQQEPLDPEITLHLCLPRLNPEGSEYNATALVKPSDGVSNLSLETVSYNRLDVSRLKELPEGELLPFADIAFPTTTHAILSTINEALGLDLDSSEVVDEVISEIPTNGIKLVIKSCSFAWLPGETVFEYAPGATTPTARAIDRRVPVDDQGRQRMRIGVE